MSPYRIMVVDDKETMRSLFQRILTDHQVITAGDGAKALAMLDADQPFDVIVSDIRMPGLDGLSLLKEVKRVQPETEVILMTAYAEVGDAVEAMKAGAMDYLVKPFDPDDAVAVVNKALDKRKLRQQARHLRDAMDTSSGFGPFIGKSDAMRKVYGVLEKAAASDVNVLIVGESGTGKELAAHAIHLKSKRRDSPFLPVNCGALPVELAESEFFGHVKGSFTGSVKDKPGLFEEAAGGTLFLDEVNALPPAVQVKLNRAIEEREGRRVGANRSYAIDVRLVAASNVDLKAEVDAGRFREDLYFRLHVLAVRLPALRKRKEDIPLLIAHFLKALDSGGTKGVSPEAFKVMMEYSWPGNVRELRNALESALAVSEASEISVEDLPQHISETSAGMISEDHLTRLTYQEACDLGRDRIAGRYLQALIKAHKGNVTAAAERAGIQRETLHRLLRKHNIDPSEFRG
ncbi:MAG: sigma-54 dependent transcriptional regulator [bacterium]|jgi:DNA-binding NtrC family response regulator